MICYLNYTYQGGKITKKVQCLHVNFIVRFKVPQVENKSFTEIEKPVTLKESKM